MARIPLGNFGNAIADPAPRINIPRGAFSAGEGLQKLGDTGMQVASAAMEEQRQQNDALKRTQAANALLDHEIAVKTAGQDIAQQLADGTMNYKEAADAYKSRIADIPKPDAAGFDPVTAENFSRGVKRNEFIGANSVAQSINSAKIADQKAEVDLGLDKIGKLAGMPGADVPAELAKMDAYDQQGRLAYGKNWASKKQEFQDKAWFNEAQQRVLQNNGNLAALKAMESDLKDTKGRYADKLDPEKRIVIENAVISHRVMLENKIQHNADRMEAMGGRTINEIDRQLSSGVPASPQMWDAWAATVKGTSYEGEFKARIQDESKMQEVLRLPPDQQTSFVQARQAELLNNGGSIRDKVNLDRLKNAVDANVKQLKETPLLYAQNRAGQPVEPIDFNAPKDAARILRDRVNSVNALQKQYGPQVQMKPLLPYEADYLSKSLDSMPPKQQADMFGMMHMAFGDDTAYRAAMQQIAPDNPVIAVAGIRASQNPSASNLILRGQQILRPDKKSDGQGKLLAMPPETELNAEFSKREQNAYAGKERAQSSAYQTAKSIYAAQSVDSGDYSGKLDYGRWRESIDLATGGFETYKGRTIVLPYGVDSGAFKDGIETRTAAIVASGALDSSYTHDKLRDLPLENVGDGRYIFRAGDGVVADKSGKPIILDFNKP